MRRLHQINVGIIARPYLSFAFVRQREYVDFIVVRQRTVTVAIQTREQIVHFFLAHISLQIDPLLQHGIILA